MSSLKLTIELLPRGAWGNNLRERLSKKDWDTLRNICYEKSKHSCAVCGNIDTELQAHEVWEFDIPSKTQTLKDIIALCPACHGVKHIRNSDRIGYGLHSKSHFLKVNNCEIITFANHYANAQFLFEERNKIRRWNLKADLAKFGGKEMIIKEKNIPLIANPYESVNWETAKHLRMDSKNEYDVFEETIVLDCNAEPSETTQNAMYFVKYKQNNLPPRISSITVDNYSGTITVSSDRVNKIQWISGEKIIKTKYNIVGKFTTKFSVENLEGSDIRFVMTGEGGQTYSQTFELTR